MLSRAMRLCEASHAHLFTFDGEQVKPDAAEMAERYGAETTVPELAGGSPAPGVAAATSTWW